MQQNAIIIDKINKNNIILTNNDNIRGLDGEYRELFTHDIPRHSSLENNKNIIHDDKKYSMIYRYKFTELFMEQLYIFSKVHQYDERSDFKEAWTIWIEENKEMINDEINRLNLLNYDGNILEKMYKSARYYFRKKTNEKKEPLKRRKYISVTKELLDAMDEHILCYANMENYQPKTGFVDFCNQQKDILRTSISKICKEGTTDPVLIQEKMKKTYKNRYFMIVNKKI